MAPAACSEEGGLVFDHFHIIKLKFAKTLALHREGILNYYSYRISTAPLEGANNKSKTMQRQTYGVRNREFFKLKILAIHESKYALVG